MRPFQASSPASVTTNAGTLARAKEKPWRVPTAVPASTATMTASHSGTPWFTFSTAKTAAARPLTEPTERSIWPISSTKTMPTAIRPVPTMSTLRLDRFRGERKFSLRD